MERRRPIPVRRSASRPSALRLTLLSAVLVLLAGFYWMHPAPSQKPVTYRMGAVDERFSLGPGDAARAVRDAAGIWSRAAGRELFREDARGDIEVRFVYDYRQEASDKLKGMGGTISCTRASYDALRARHEREAADFRQREALLMEDVGEYNRQVESLNAEIRALSRRGATEGDERRINEARQSLEAVLAGIRARQEEQRASMDNLNSLVVVINGIAESLNLEVVRYNRTGSVLQSEFSEGLYERKNNRESITIYHFTSRERLVRVLAHEFGHALGLEHGADPKSIMYRLNQSDSLSPSPGDRAALKAALKERGM